MVHVDGAPWYRARVVFETRDNGQAVFLDGRMIGSTNTAGAGGLALLSRHPGQRLHIYDLEATEAGIHDAVVSLGETKDESGLRSLLGRASVKLDAARLCEELEPQELDRLAAVLRRIALLDADAESVHGLPDERPDLRAAIEADLTQDTVRFPSEAVPDRARPRVTNKLRRAINDLGKQDADLALAFSQAFKLGEFASYDPAAIDLSAPNESAK
jgi:hypothetical protein